MTTKEHLKAELETLSEEDIAALLHDVRRFPRTPVPPVKQTSPGILAKLRRIEIDGPEDILVSGREA